MTRTVGAGGLRSDSIVFDRQGRAYNPLTIRLADGTTRNVLMVSWDRCLTWSVYDLPAGEFAVEHWVGHNEIDGPAVPGGVAAVHPEPGAARQALLPMGDQTATGRRQTRTAAARARHGPVPGSRQGFRRLFVRRHVRRRHDVRVVGGHALGYAGDAAVRRHLRPRHRRRQPAAAALRRAARERHPQQARHLHRQPGLSALRVGHRMGARHVPAVARALHHRRGLDGGGARPL